MVEGSLNMAAVELFLTSHLNGSLPRFVKSQPLPDDPYDDGIRVLVADSMDAAFKEFHQELLVLLYNPHCSHCLKMLPKFEELCGLLKDVPGLECAKLDESQNELPWFLGTVGFPALVHVPRDKPQPDSYLAIKNKELKEMLAYVKTHSLAYRTFIENLKKES
jgi:thiol-disulfide isomerase/thioredoxin